MNDLELLTQDGRGNLFNERQKAVHGEIRVGRPQVIKIMVASPTERVLQKIRLEQFCPPGANAVVLSDYDSAMQIVEDSVGKAYFAVQFYRI